jgi:ornithine carbamoyltransferase
MNLIKLTDLSKEEIIGIIELAFSLKKHPLNHNKYLIGKNLLFASEKPSLRTRLSFEVAMSHLGGNCIYYDLKDSTIGKKESWKDAAKVVERYVDIISLRVFDHDIFNELTSNINTPVINALSNDYHPLQALADLMTIKEKFGRISKINLAYVGNGDCNVLHSLILGSAMFNINLKIGCPKKLQPSKKVVKQAKNIGIKVLITEDVKKAVKNADVVYTDTWESYHNNKNLSKILKPYQVNKKLMSLTKNAMFMHCLPAHRGKEVTDSVIDSKKSLVYRQAENRLHTQKALILKMLKCIS